MKGCSICDAHESYLKTTKLKPKVIVLIRKGWGFHKRRHGEN